MTWGVLEIDGILYECYLYPIDKGWHAKVKQYFESDVIIDSAYVGTISEVYDLITEELRG